MRAHLRKKKKVFVRVEQPPVYVIVAYAPRRIRQQSRRFTHGTYSSMSTVEGRETEDGERKNRTRQLLRCVACLFSFAHFFFFAASLVVVVVCTAQRNSGYKRTEEKKKKKTNKGIYVFMYIYIYSSVQTEMKFCRDGGSLHSCQNTEGEVTMREETTNSLLIICHLETYISCPVFRWRRDAVFS